MTWLQDTHPIISANVPLKPGYHWRVNYRRLYPCVQLVRTGLFRRDRVVGSISYDPVYMGPSTLVRSMKRLATHHGVYAA